MNTFFSSFFCSTGTPGERRRQRELKGVRENKQENKKCKQLEESNLHICALLNLSLIVCPLHALPGSAGFRTFWSNVSSKDTIRGIKVLLKPSWGEVTALPRAMGLWTRPGRTKEHETEQSVAVRQQAMAERAPSNAFTTQSPSCNNFPPGANSCTRLCSSVMPQN